MIRRLRWKMTLMTTLLSALLLSAVCAAFLLSLESGLRRDSLSVLYRVISETETPQWSAKEKGTAISLPYFTVTVTPNGGTEVTSSQFYDLTDYDRFTAAVDAALSQGREQGEVSGESLRYLRQATSDGWRMAFVDVSYERSTLKKAVVTVTAMGLVGVAVLYALSALLARWAVRPVEESVQQQRQFVADASHELKTPLTVMLSNAELILRTPELSPSLRRWAENIRTGGGEMEKLIEEMLLLARSDQRQKTPAAQRQEVDLSDLTENALLFFEPVLYEAGLRLEEGEIAPGVAVAGDSAALGRLAEILLDNAVKYTPKGGGIRVSLTESEKKAVLRVANQGKPIPEEERERIFRRFYRSDAARSSKGFGLGLAIAREIAQEHGGTLDAASTPEGYNVFQCVLPLAN